MKSLLKNIIKPVLPKKVFELREGLRLIDLTKSISARQCPCCGYHGHFAYFGHPPRIDARCPSCGSLERHRLLILAIKSNDIGPISGLSGMTMLHFAPEPVLMDFFSARVGQYTTADLYREDVDKNLDIEKIDYPDNSFDLVLASHVLEHVNDVKASHEIARILKPNGVLLAMVPIIDGWERTYENAQITTESDRVKHFGQSDHVRFYGGDFSERIENGGLSLVAEFTAFGENCVKYSLLRGEKVFVFQKV